MIKNKTGKKIVTLYIKQSQYDELTELASIREVSYAHLVREAIDQYLKKLERKNQIISPLK